MEHPKSAFLAFSADAQRLAANLEQAYSFWLDARRQYEALPVSMFWQTKSSTDYLVVKDTSASSGKSLGPRSPDTEARYERHTTEKAQLKERIKSADQVIAERASTVRRLRLPAMADQQAEILRDLDVGGLLGTDLMVVGTNAFVAYQVACGAHFPTGNEETEDFEADFQPMASLVEQEWLLQGRPLAAVVATLRMRACPLYVPDPRWMALRKLWLSRKPERNPAKRGKDQRQGEVLLDATRHFLPHSHPLDVGFVLDLPEELRPTFDAWAAQRAFIPAA